MSPQGDGMTFSHRVTTRVSFVGAVVVLGLLAISAALALATAGGGGGFAAKQKLLAVRCPVGQVAEAGGDCAQIGGGEGPIESFAAAAERTAKQSAPFQTVAPGAAANALNQRNRKSKTGGSGAGTDVGVFISSTATGGTYSVLGNLPPMPVVHLSIDPANPKRIIAATYARGVYAYTFA
jgi:hypothetical protein